MISGRGVQLLFGLACVALACASFPCALSGATTTGPGPVSSACDSSTEPETRVSIPLNFYLRAHDRARALPVMQGVTAPRVIDFVSVATRVVGNEAQINDWQVEPDISKASVDNQTTEVDSERYVSATIASGWSATFSDRLKPTTQLLSAFLMIDADAGARYEYRVRVAAKAMATYRTAHTYEVFFSANVCLSMTRHNVFAEGHFVGFPNVDSGGVEAAKTRLSELLATAYESALRDIGVEVYRFPSTVCSESLRNE